jgi:hypothetical protein
MLFRQLVNRMCSHCLFPAYWKVVNGLLTTCYKVVEFNRVVTSCSNNLLSSCTSTICQQVVSDSLVATWWNNRIVTTCWQACILLTSCEIFTCVHASQHRIVSPIFHNFHFQTIQALKYRSVTDIVRPIREIVRRREETTGHSVRPDILSDQSETEVYCLSDPSVLVTDRTVALSDVNQNVP